MCEQVRREMLWLAARAPVRRSRAVVPAVALLLLSACGSGQSGVMATAARPSAATERALTTATAIPTDTPSASPEPTPTATPTATAVPATPAPTPRPAPVTPEPSSAPSAAPSASAAPRGEVSAVGDSVMLGAASALRAEIPTITVDAVVSRQWNSGVSTVDAMRSSGRLGPEVVVDLGTNGTVTAPQFDAMVRAAAGARRIVVVTVRVPRPWQEQVNAVLRDGVARHPNTVLADWYATSAGHGEWFASDGYHLQTQGARAFAALIAGVL
jgi:hypothetical protein